MDLVSPDSSDIGLSALACAYPSNIRIKTKEGNLERWRILQERKISQVQVLRFGSTNRCC